MDASAIIAIVIAGAIFVTAAVIGIRIIVKRPKVITGTEPVIWDGPEGRTVDIPTRQLSVVAPGALSFLALGRYSGRSALRLTPKSIHSLTIRTKTIPYEKVVQVEVPYRGYPEFVVLRYENGTGVGASVSSLLAADALLYELSARCRLSPEAYHRIARFLQPHPGSPQPPSWGPPQQGPPQQAGWR